MQQIMPKMKVDILPITPFLNSDGTFDMDSALLYQGRIGGICYSEEGLQKNLNEDEITTRKRLNDLLKKEHFSVFDHVHITFHLQNVPKIINIFLNNEKVYNTTEKSLRYVGLDREDTSLISPKEKNLYDKWKDILEEKINEEYGHIYSESKIKSLAKENARYLVSVFVPTDMVHTLSLRQLNLVAKYMEDYIKNADRNDYFEAKTAADMEKLLSEFTRLNVLERRLMVNNPNEQLSLIGHPEDKKEFFNRDTYSTTYKGSFAYLGQAQRHRTINYEVSRLEEPEFYVPPILTDDKFLEKEWLDDMDGAYNLVPQGEILLINEQGSLKKLIDSKAWQRNCSRAQLEIMQRTFNLLKKYERAMTEQDDISAAKEIRQYTRGMRCTYPNAVCKETCNLSQNMKMNRKI